MLCDDREQWDREQVGGRTKREGIHVCCCFVPQSCLTLCYPMECSPPGSSVHGISHGQTYWSGLPFPSPGDRPDSGIKPTSPALAGGFFITEPPGKSTLDRYLVVKLLGYVITLSLPSWETAKLFPKWLCHFSCSVVGNKCSNFSTFSLVTVCPLFV